MCNIEIYDLIRLSPYDLVCWGRPKFNSTEESLYKRNKDVIDNSKWDECDISCYNFMFMLASKYLTSIGKNMPRKLESNVKIIVELRNSLSHNKHYEIQEIDKIRKKVKSKTALDAKVVKDELNEMLLLYDEIFKELGTYFTSYGKPPPTKEHIYIRKLVDDYLKAVDTPSLLIEKIKTLEIAFQKEYSELSSFNKVMEKTAQKLGTSTLQIENTTLKLDTSTLQMENTTQKINMSTLQMDNTATKLDTSTLLMENTAHKLDVSTLQMENTTTKLDKCTLQMENATQKLDTKIQQLIETGLGGFEFYRSLNVDEAMPKKMVIQDAKSQESVNAPAAKSEAPDKMKTHQNIAVTRSVKGPTSNLKSSDETNLHPNVAKTVSYIVKDLLKAIYMSIKEPLSRNVSDHLTTLRPRPEFKSKNKLCRKIMLDMRKKGNIDDFIMYIREPQKALKSWAEKYVSDHCMKRDLNGKSLIGKKANELFRNKVTEVIECVKEASKSNEITFEDWLQLFNNAADEIISISDTLFDDFDMQELQVMDINYFTTYLIKSLDDLKSSQEKILDDWELNHLKAVSKPPHVLISERLLGCTAQCPLCGVMCSQATAAHHPGTDHTALHSHYPRGLRGGYDSDTKELRLTTCNEEVAGDGTFRIARPLAGSLLSITTIDQ
ncbi:unnamed protein product [Meganyctiphanes norvegica]|uniref:DZIP3-like HEPN domain-containing protein n=1 Tax=Meganyctiphanes norvegica TaxID=48144 RepID=A0AAV2QVP9_MEGNR